MVVDTLSGVPRVGGKVIGGNTACILVVMKASLTNDVSNELFPVALSPTMQIQTGAQSVSTTSDGNYFRRRQESQESQETGTGTGQHFGIPVAMVHSAVPPTVLGCSLSLPLSLYQVNNSILVLYVGRLRRSIPARETTCTWTRYSSTR